MSSKKIDKSPFVLSELTALSPLDGRYLSKLQALAPFVSEHALIKTRFEIEAKYLLALESVGIVRLLTTQEKKQLSEFAKRVSLKVAEEVKDIEKETRHDVKAMERAFRNLVKGSSLEDVTEMIHFGLTSDDVNNMAYRLLLYRGTQGVIIPQLESLLDNITQKAEQYKTLPMLARTHGQPAVPTTLGKELVNTAYRLHKQLGQLKTQKLNGKLTGAVGNFNALQAAYPKINWLRFSRKFVASFDFEPLLFTTQINPYDDVIEYLQILQRINTILIDFDQDIWRYISDGWFVQEAKKGEIGSSTMPQKVNPIDFENSEGNLGLANSIIEFMARKLMISRLQRDLSDSTVMRNIGIVLSYCLLGYQSTLIGLGRIRANETAISEELQRDWTILTEGVQTVLRKEGVADPYSLIAGLSRGKHITEGEWHEWIESLPVEQTIKKELLELTPYSYIGLAVELTEKAIAEIRKR